MGKKKSPEGLVDEVEAYVKKLPWRERVKICGTFHEFDLWPEELPMKPEGWDNMSRDEKWDITLPICDRLDCIAGLSKASLRYWYIRIRGHSKKEFREYWKNRYKGKEPDYQVRAYIMGIWTGLNIATIIIQIAMIIKRFS